MTACAWLMACATESSASERIGWIRGDVTGSPGDWRRRAPARAYWRWCPDVPFLDGRTASAKMPIPKVRKVIDRPGHRAPASSRCHLGGVVDEDEPDDEAEDDPATVDEYPWQECSDRRHGRVRCFGTGPNRPDSHPGGARVSRFDWVSDSCRLLWADGRRIRSDAALQGPPDRHRHPHRTQDRRAAADPPAWRRRRGLDGQPELDPGRDGDIPARAWDRCHRRPDRGPGRARPELARRPGGEARPDPRQWRRPVRALPGGSVRGADRRDGGDDVRARSTVATPRPDREAAASSSTTARSSSSPRTRMRSARAPSKRSCASRTGSPMAGA